ncbi:MAG: hypothetical protein K9J84_13255 [Bacteroidia bacterium]|nr:hypothetical protein [Bacteroidia bacterium]
MRIVKIIIVTSLVLFLYSCDSTVKDISMELEKMAVSSKNDTIAFKFSDLIGSNYDSLLVVPPYTMVDRVEKDFEITLDEIEKLGIERRDDIYVLCLFKDNILIEYKILRRNSVDYTNIADLYFIKKGTKLRIIKNQGIYNIEKARH